MVEFYAPSYGCDKLVCKFNKIGAKRCIFPTFFIPLPSGCHQIFQPSLPIIGHYRRRTSAASYHRHSPPGFSLRQPLYTIMVFAAGWFTHFRGAIPSNLVETAVFAVLNLVETAVFAILNLVESE